ncbi:hypothetical protein WJU23_19410 [Prosthecobacter sp. SYSU 5D2]|uniref:hypothetical protein n=1 Tax=Prosthecobacter sp. SYSU 5D2 TaxID=3134134 RepID=UPI0031FE77F0
MKPRLHQIVLLVAAMGSLIQAQTPANPGLLEGLMSDQAPSADEVRLHITVLKVPAAAAAQALLADAGRTPRYWQETVTSWQARGIIELVTEISEEGRPGHREFLDKKAETFRYIYQDMSSHYWDEDREWEAYQNKPWAEKMDANRILQELAEAEVGNAVQARVGMKLGDQQAGLELNLKVTPNVPASRPVRAWPLPYLSAPRYFFRPWHLMTTANVPVNEIFLLGCQMEPPHDGQVQTGQVMMAFARLTAAQPAPSKVPPYIGPMYRAQSWTLAIPLNDYQAWLKTRRDAQGDEAQMARWLGTSGGSAGVELLATSAVACLPGEDSRMETALLWHDATGWEPSSNPLIFSPLSCDGDDAFMLGHSLEISLAHVGRPDPTGNPFAPVAISNADFHSEMAVRMAINRPSAPARWVRCKTSFEGSDADDLHGIEIAEADMEPNESTATQLIANVGQVSMVGASLKDGRIHASFVRVVEAGSQPQVSVAPFQAVYSSALTTWIIETPLSWRGRLLTDEAPDFKGLADELLASVGREEVECVGLTVIEGKIDRGSVRSMRPQLYFGGEYLNSATHAKGIYFNPRSLLMLNSGEEVETDLSGDRRQSWQVRSAGVPEVRRWGIWQPDIPTTSAASSYMALPSQPLMEVSSMLQMTPHQPEVVAVMQTSAIGAVQPSSPRLRWHVVRYSTPAQPKDEPALPAHSSAPVPDPVHRVQAVVLKLSAGWELPHIVSKAAEDLFKASREGTVEILECVTVSLEDSGSAKLRSGWDMYFTNGRLRGANETEEDVLWAPAKMPAGTQFSSQIDVRHRLVGCQLEISNGQWTLIRDVSTPQTVTDTFADVIQEWPSPQPDGPDWEQLPKVRVCVQRPIFDVQGGEGPLPAVGEFSITYLADDTVLVLRVLR